MKKCVNEHGEHMVSMTFDEIGAVTEDDREMLRKAREMQPVYDEDCPPMSEDMHRAIQKQIAQKRKIARNLAQPCRVTVQ